MCVKFADLELILISKTSIRILNSLTGTSGVVHTSITLTLFSCASVPHTSRRHGRRPHSHHNLTSSFLYLTIRRHHRRHRRHRHRHEPHRRPSRNREPHHRPNQREHRLLQLEVPAHAHDHDGTQRDGHARLPAHAGAVHGEKYFVALSVLLCVCNIVSVPPASDCNVNAVVSSSFICMICACS